MVASPPKKSEIVKLPPKISFFQGRQTSINVKTTNQAWWDSPNTGLTRIKPQVRYPDFLLRLRQKYWLVFSLIGRTSTGRLLDRRLRLGLLITIYLCPSTSPSLALSYTAGRSLWRWRVDVGQPISACLLVAPIADESLAAASPLD